MSRVVAAGTALQSLTEEQLQQLEGMERANVEARIAVLRDVQKLLDSAVLRLNQYTTVMSIIRCVHIQRLFVLSSSPSLPPLPFSPPAGPGFPGYPFPPFPAQGDPSSTAMDPSSTTMDSIPNSGSSSSQNQGGEMEAAAQGGGAVAPDADQPTPSASGSSEFKVSGSGGGLFQSQNVYSRGMHDKRHSSGASSDYQEARSSMQQQPLQRVLVEDGTSSGELVLNNASSHVDSDIRQRRLQRLHSSPTTSQQSLSPLAETSEGEQGSETRHRFSRDEDFTPLTPPRGSETRRRSRSSRDEDMSLSRGELGSEIRYRSSRDEDTLSRGGETRHRSSIDEDKA